MAAMSLPKCVVAGQEFPSSFFPLTSRLPPEALEQADAFITKGDPPDVLIEKIQNLL